MLQVLDHGFGTIAVLADESVNMVRHDRASIAGVAALGDYAGEACANLFDLGIVEG
jgi:hypothetical protein